MIGVGVKQYINRIVRADCSKLLRSFPDECIDFIFTDPPYGHNNNNNGDLISRREAALGLGDYVAERDNIPIMNDGVEANDLFKSLLPQFFRVLKRDTTCCCCCGGGGGPDLQFARWSLWFDEVFNFKQMVVWDKGPMGMGWHYRRSYEVVLVGDKGRGSWYDDSHRIENIVRHIRKIIPRKDQHPTAKPVALAEHFIQLHTKENDLVLDPFAGSGSTLIACHNLNRRYIGIELDPKFVKMATKRLLKETESSQDSSKQHHFF